MTDLISHIDKAVERKAQQAAESAAIKSNLVGAVSQVTFNELSKQHGSKSDDASTMAQIMGETVAMSALNIAGKHIQRHLLVDHDVSVPAEKIPEIAKWLVVKEMIDSQGIGAFTNSVVEGIEKAKTKAMRGKVIRG